VAAVGEEAYMPLEFSYEGFVFRVDGDVLEIFRRGAFSERVPLAWLAVQVQPFARGRLAVRIVSASRDVPLYEVMQKAKPAPGSALELSIAPEEEPLFRQFFTQVAQLCGRPAVP
jgi:hypothetical protein